MTRRLVRRAVPLCVLVVGLLAAHFLRATSVAHAHVVPARASVKSSPSPDRDQTSGRGPSAAALSETTSVLADGEVAESGPTGRLQPDGSLSDVAGLSPSDVWAVGQQSAWDFWRNRGVVTHWDGVSWVEVPLRGDSTGAGHLRSVAAVSSGEIWAVGDGHDGLPYVARGSKDGLTRVGVPQLRPGDWLGGVAASASRVVAVGTRDGRAFMAASGGSAKGAAWTTDGGPEGSLYGVALAGRSDGWAVGDTGTRPLVMRLTADGWKEWDVPEIDRGFLRDVYAEGRKGAIAIGGVYDADGSIMPLVLTWNGRRWTREDPPERHAELYGVTGDGAGTFWISGYDPAHAARGFVLRYDGSRWATLRGQVPSKDRTVRLQAVAHVAGHTIAVGHVLDDADHYSDLVERVGPATRDE
ncbi:hypothetical protein JOL79_01415 [Microbispora sp. RL4-1S]|uniref:Uncharacterized protein n=1 Tax=Microbispora oryzae TaxID=2806554 RepID=A0A940WJS4_9ACTN|nr:hypothetical protein [Microbispora oryzae]MBP2702456.1 hypothetical protein [Microbispora oryzae]